MKEELLELTSRVSELRETFLPGNRSWIPQSELEQAFTAFAAEHGTPAQYASLLFEQVTGKPVPDVLTFQEEFEDSHIGGTADQFGGVLRYAPGIYPAQLRWTLHELGHFTYQGSESTYLRHPFGLGARSPEMDMREEVAAELGRGAVIDEQ